MFATPYLVKFADVDNAGIFYYPRFFNAFHVAFEQWWASVGRPYHAVIQDDRVGFPAVRIETDFRIPVTFGDPVDIQIACTRIGNTSITIRFRFVNRESGANHCEAHITNVCVDMDTFEPMPPPPHIRELLEQLREE